ncbi:hypothetical protein JXO59_16360 [candidate division KSB1 bacterium]|nr:hypothetical protein [candidate division KSB1 bacterium]
MKSCRRHLSRLRAIAVIVGLCATATVAGESIRDHQVVLDTRGRLQPWTTYDNIIHWSMNFIFDCPTRQTIFGDDPWYLITSKFSSDGTFQEQNTKQNNQGSNVFWAMETAKKYYAYSGDARAFLPVRLLLQRILYYLTPPDWAWPGVPRTQDDTPDGEYTDERSEPDKMAMVALACVDYYRIFGQDEFLAAAKQIAAVIGRSVRPGNAEQSPVPFRVNLRTGEVLDAYSASAVVFIKLFDQILPYCSKEEQTRYDELRRLVWDWIRQYPLVNYRWSGYYEDVVSNHANFNQQTPMETARYLLQHPHIDPDYRQHVPALLQWVEDRFGRTRHFGAVSIREQDSCFLEMSSHTARFASIAAMWYGCSGDTLYAEKARASFALATYSAYNKYSRDEKAINYVGIGYDAPWFSDSYWDYIAHFFDGMAELPGMLPEDENHLFYSNATIRTITYSPRSISYETVESDGEERIKLTFDPQVFSAEQSVDHACWEFGAFCGVDNILRIRRKGINTIDIRPR